MTRKLASSLKWYLRVLDHAAKLNHTIVQFQTNAENLEQQTELIRGTTKINIVCNTCQTKFLKRVKNYVKLTIGCPTCIDKKNYSFLSLSAKQKKEETLRRNAEQKREALFDQAIKNPYYSVGNDLHDLRKVSSIWKGVLWQAYEGRCFITGEESCFEDPLQLHHLYSVSKYPDKQNVLTNGVLIKASLHREFHSLYGNDTTAEDFERFLIEKGKTVKFPWQLAEFEIKTKTLKNNIIKAAEIYGNKFEAIVLQRNHLIIKYENPGNLYLNKETLVTITCNLCEQPSTETKYVHDYKKQRYGLQCCASKARSAAAKQKRLLFNNSLNSELKDSVAQSSTSEDNLLQSLPVTKLLRRDLMLNKLKQKIEHHGHVLLGFEDSPTIVDKYTPVIINCKKHNLITTKAYCDYLRSPCGTPCCSAEKGNNKRRETVLKLIEETKQALHSSEDKDV